MVTSFWPIIIHIYGRVLPVLHTFRLYSFEFTNKITVHALAYFPHRISPHRCRLSSSFCSRAVATTGPRPYSRCGQTWHSDHVMHQSPSWFLPTQDLGMMCQQICEIDISIRIKISSAWEKVYTDWFNFDIFTIIMKWRVWIQKPINSNFKVVKVSPSSNRAKYFFFQWYLTHYITRNLFEVMMKNVTYFLYIFFVFQQL